MGLKNWKKAKSGSILYNILSQRRVEKKGFVFYNKKKDILLDIGKDRWHNWQVYIGKQKNPFIRRKQFKTKPQALKFAKDYMRQPKFGSIKSAMRL